MTQQACGEERWKCWEETGQLIHTGRKTHGLLQDVSLAKERMPWKTKVLWGYLTISLGTWHQVLRSLGLFSPEPLLYHGVGHSPLHQPLWANMEQSQGPRGHTAMSPNRSQAPHQPVQVSSFLCSAHSALQRQSLGANRAGETSCSPNTGGCLVKRSFWFFFFF